MAYQIGVREFTKNFNKLQDIDIIEIVDKKSSALKGIYVSAKEAIKVKKLLEEDRKEKRIKKLSKIMKYAGNLDVDDNFKDLSADTLKVKIAELKNGK